MEKIFGVLKELIVLIKNYGIDAVYWLMIIGYVLGMIYPQLSNEVLSVGNVVVLGIMYLGVKFFNSGVFKNESLSLENKHRKKANTLIKTELLKMKSEAFADRAFIFEGHNGINNASNLAFYFMNMNYEIVNTNHYISTEYVNLSTSIYDFPDYIAEKFYFVGTIDELIEIDPRLGHRFQDDNVKFLACTLLKSNGIVIGILGVTYLEIPKLSKGEILAKLAVYAQDISNYLDLEKLKKH